MFWNNHIFKNIFNFGKYKYQELSYVVENDLDYALWVLRSVNKLEKDDLCVLKKLTQEKLFSMLDMFVDYFTKRRKSKKIREGVTVKAQDLKTRLPEDMFGEICEMHPLV